MTSREAPETPAGRIRRLLEQVPQAEAELAQALLLSEGELSSRLEGGGAALSLSELVVAADILDVPVTYLAGQSSGERNFGVSLRLGQVERLGAPMEALEHVDMMFRHLHLLDLWQGPTPNVLQGLDPDFSFLHKEAGERTAGKVRDALELDDRPIEDLVRLVEDCGIPVTFQPLPKGLHGINVRDEQSGRPRRVIVINCRDYWTRQRYTLAHEWCHGLYDDAGQVIVNEVDEVDPPETLPEIRAEYFARHLLLPQGVLAAEVTAARTARTQPSDLVARLMLLFGVSRKVVLKALVDDGHVPAGDTRLEILKSESVQLQMSRVGYAEKWRELCESQHEPAGSPWLVERAVTAYGHGLVDVAVVAELLGEDEASVAERLAAAGW